MISLRFLGFAIKFFLENFLVGFFFAIAFFCALYFLPHGLGILFLSSGVAAFAQI